MTMLDPPPDASAFKDWCTLQESEHSYCALQTGVRAVSGSGASEYEVKMER